MDHSRIRIAFILLLTVIFAGTTGYYGIEDMPVFDAFYMTVITISTVSFLNQTPFPGRRILTIVDHHFRNQRIDLYARSGGQNLCRRGIEKDLREEKVGKANIRVKQPLYHLRIRTGLVQLSAMSLLMKKFRLW